MRRAAIASLCAALALAAGCASPPAPQAPTPAPAAPPPAPSAPIPAPAVPLKDACGAADLQRLVGRPRSEIPVPVDPNRQRVACTTCPVTLDYRPERLNFFFDAQTGAIREIRCG